MSDRPPLGTALVIALLATLLCAAVGSRHVIHELDTIRYQRLARNLVHHGAYSSCPVDEPDASPHEREALKPEFERMPGYPVFLAAIELLAPRSDLAIIIAQAVLHGLTVFSLFLLACALTGLARFGWLAAAAWGVYPYAIFYAISLMSETLTVAAGCAGLAALALYLRRPSGALLATAAAAFVVASYTRPNMVAMPVFLLGITVLVPSLRRSGAQRALGVIVAVVLVSLVPWTVRNQRAFGKPMFGSHNYLGANVCEAAVQFVLPVNEIEPFCFKDANGFLLACGVDDNLRYDAIIRERGMDVVRAHPLRTLAYSGFRPLRVWFSYNIQDGHNRLVELAMRFGTLALLPLFIIGCYLLWRRSDLGWLPVGACLFVSAIHVVLVVSSRYSMIAKPYYVLAIVFLLAQMPWLRRRVFPGA